jgi:hypothetical protein
MPRAGPRRPLAFFRLSQNGLDYIDQLATEEGMTKPDGTPNRSEMIRNLLAYAVRKRPKGWRP